MRLLLTILLLFSLQTEAGTYYCTTSQEAQARFNSAGPGDVISLLRGMTFTGAFTLSKSGTAPAPITINSYGVLDAPIISGTVEALLTINNKSYIVIDGLNFTDPSMDTADHWLPSKAKRGIEVSGSFVTIRNCRFTLLGVGINLQGSYCTIENNYIGNLRMVKNTPTSQNSDDDYGASPIVVSGSHNIITHNYFKDCWAYSYDYGYDGGGVEFYGNGSGDNTIMYNTVINCNGFNEFGSGNGGNSDNNLIAYNLLINCGDLVYTNSSGQYAITVNNLQYYNNIIVETRMQFTGVQQMVIIGSNSQISMKNNIFYLMTGVDVARSGIFSLPKNIHENNVYRLATGSVLNFNPGASERITTQNLFTSITGDPSTWNYQPLATSPASNAGQWVGIDRDIIGTPVAQIPCAGAYEYLSTTPIQPTPPSPVPIPAPFVWNNRQEIIITSRRFDQWTLFDIIGRKLAQGKYGVGRTVINIDRYAAGIYLLKAEFKTYKIIK
jgi:hypothetical protein